MTSLGRLIFFDQPGTGASDPVTPNALPTLEQWADSITALLDDLGSCEAVLLASNGGSATAALFAATHPSRTTALVVLEGYAGPMVERTDGHDLEEFIAGMLATWGTGESQHVVNPDMPWNEEIRATWARHERLARAGLHSGECEIRGDDIGGIAVHIGARVSALAGPNDVLVSSTLRDLVIGSGLEFEERGAHRLKRRARRLAPLRRRVYLASASSGSASGAGVTRIRSACGRSQSGNQSGDASPAHSNTPPDGSST
jgi:pimeloyl-ACP methyl ester carboxylesterase